MSISYTNEPDTIRADDRPFVPAYARTAARKRGKVRTWMILAPIGAVVLGGAAVAMLMGGENTTPLVEPETASAPLIAPLTPVAPPVAAPVAPIEAAPVAVAPAPAPVAAPVARRAAPAARPATRVAPPVAEPAPATAALNAEPAGPRPYQPSTPTVVVTPTTPAAPTPTAAPIVIQP